VFVGGTGGNSDTDTFPKAINSILGTKMKLVTGYPGGNDITLALQRGEVQARCGWSWSSIKTNHAAWVKDGTLKILAQLALEKHPDLPHVPLIMDMVKTPEQRQVLRLVFAGQVMGRPFLAPPGIPADRLAALRKAFMATMQDPAFLAEAEKIKLEIRPVSGGAVQKLVAEVYASPPEVVKKAAAALR
jgi:tripartite-type tricarboxylate transporter receptor subunit TctC